MVVARGEERGESTDTERFNRAESGNEKGKSRRCRRPDTNP
jgi:hypothetical protein